MPPETAPNKVSLLELADLAIGTPEVGAVNFTALHALIVAMLKNLNLQELLIDFQSPMMERGRSIETVPSTDTLRPRLSAPHLPGTASKEKDRRRSVGRMPSQVLESQVKDLGGQVQDLNKQFKTIDSKIQGLMTHVEYITAGLDLERPRFPEEMDMSALRPQTVQIKSKKILKDTGEVGPVKAMDLLQDIIEDVKILKEAHQKAQESQELKPQEVLNRIEEVEKRIKDRDVLLEQIGQKLNLIPGGEEATMVTWEDLEQAITDGWRASQGGSEPSMEYSKHKISSSLMIQGIPSGPVTKHPSVDQALDFAGGPDQALSRPSGPGQSPKGVTSRQGNRGSSPGLFGREQHPRARDEAESPGPHEPSASQFKAESDHHRTRELSSSTNLRKDKHPGPAHPDLSSARDQHHHVQTDQRGGVPIGEDQVCLGPGSPGMDRLGLQYLRSHSPDVVPLSVSQLVMLPPEMGEQRLRPLGMDQPGVMAPLVAGRDQQGLRPLGMAPPNTYQHGMMLPGTDPRSMGQPVMYESGLGPLGIDQHGFVALGTDQQRLAPPGIDQQGLALPGRDQHGSYPYLTDQYGFVSPGLMQVRADQQGFVQPSLEASGFRSPGLDQRHLIQPGRDHRGLVQPGIGQGGFVQPGTDQQVLVQPGTYQPGLVPPGAGQPGLVQPGAYPSSLAQFGTDQRGLVQPGADQQGLVQPGEGWPGWAQPGTDRHGLVQSGAYLPGLVQPEMDQGGLVQPGAAQHGLVQPGAAQHGLVQPGAAQHGLVQSGTAQHGLVQPGTAQRGLVQPGAAQRGLVQPGTDQRGLVQPEMDQGGLVQPGAAQRGLVQPGAAQRGLVQSGAAQRGLVQPGADQHGLVQPGADQSGLLQSGAAQHGLVQPGADQSGLVQPGVDQGGLVQSGMDESGLVQPSAYQQGLVQPGAAQHGLAQPGAVQRGLMQPGADQLDVVQPGVDQRGLVQSGAYLPGLMQPGADQHGLAQPGAVQRGLMQTGAAQHGLVPPGMDQYGLEQLGEFPRVQVQPEAYSPGMVQPGAYPPELVHPGADPRSLVQPGIDQHRLVQPRADQYGFEQPHIDQLGLVQPSVGQRSSMQLGVAQRGSVQLGVDQHGSMQPGMGQRGLMQPGMDQRGLVQPSVDQRGLVQPSVDQCGLVQPGADQHGLVQPGMDQSGLVQPGEGQRGSMQLGVARRGSLQSGVDQRGLVPPGMDQRGLVQPGAVQPGADQSGLVQSVVDQKGLVQPGADQQPGISHHVLLQPSTGPRGLVQPGAYMPGLAQPGAYPPGVVQPGAQQHGLFQPGATPPGLVQPGAYLHGPVQPGIVQRGLKPPGADQQGLIAPDTELHGFPTSQADSPSLESFHPSQHGVVPPGQVSPLLAHQQSLASPGIDQRDLVPPEAYLQIGMCPGTDQQGPTPLSMDLALAPPDQQHLVSAGPGVDLHGQRGFDSRRPRPSVQHGLPTRLAAGQEFQFPPFRSRDSLGHLRQLSSERSEIHSERQDSLEKLAPYFPMAVETFYLLGELVGLYMELKEKMKDLDEEEAGQTDLEKIQYLLTLMVKKTISPDLEEQLKNLKNLSKEVRQEKVKLDKLQRLLESGASGEQEAGKEPKTNQLNFQLGMLRVTVADIEKELAELRESQEQGKVTMENSVSEASLYLQDQLDKLRTIIESMLSSSSTLLSMSMVPHKPQTTLAPGQIDPEATCPACSLDLSHQVSLLVQHYEQLQDTVNNLTASRPAKKAKLQSQDEELLGHVQNAILQVQGDCEKLNITTSNLIEDHRQKQRDIDVLYQGIQKLEKEKANREHLEMEIDVKADKSALASKVSRVQFDATTEQLNHMMQDLVAKMSGQEQDWQKVLDKLLAEMDSKLDRLELDPLKKMLEDRWKSLRQQLKERSPLYQADEAAAMRRQLLAHFHCLSCDRPLETSVTGQVMPVTPVGPALPGHRSIRPYTVFELEQIRQQSRNLKLGSTFPRGDLSLMERSVGRLRSMHSKMLMDIEKVQIHFGGSVKASSQMIRELLQAQCLSHPCFKRVPESADYTSSTVPRRCGGSHTLTYPYRRNRLQHMPQGLSPLEDIQIAMKHDEMDILGLDGHIYKGRMDTRLPGILNKDTSGMTKHKSKPTRPHPHRQQSSSNSGQLPSRPQSAQMLAGNSSVSSQQHTDRPVSSEGRISQSNLAHPSSPTEVANLQDISSGLDMHMDVPPREGLEEPTRGPRSTAAH